MGQPLNKCTLNKTADVSRGGSPRPINAYITDNIDGINWIRISDASDDGYIYHTEEKILKSGIKKSFLIQPGDLLLSNSMSFGRPYISKISGCIHDGWLSIRPYANKLDSEFLKYYLSSPICKRKFLSLAAGGVVSNLNKEIVGKINIAFPAKLEQEKIAQLFSAIDYYISLLQHKFDALKKYKEGLIHGLIERGTLLGKLGNLVVFEDKTKIKSEEGKSEGAYPFFTNNTDESTKRLDYYTFDGEYIILNTGGEAYVRYYNGKFAAMSDCLVLKPKSRPISIYYFLKDFENIINSRGFQGTGLKHLDQDWLLNLKISVPAIEEYKLTKIENLFHNLSEIEESKLQRISQIKSNLLNNMFI